MADSSNNFLVVATDPFPMKLPLISHILHEQLGLNLHCLHSTIAFRLRRYEEKDIHVLLLSDSMRDVELLLHLRSSSKNFPVILCVENDLALELARAHLTDVCSLWLYKKDGENFLSLAQLINNILDLKVH